MKLPVKLRVHRITSSMRLTPKISLICCVFVDRGPTIEHSLHLLEASIVSSSEGITAEQKISKSVFAKNITSNDLFRLPERQPTQSSSFSIFEIFVLPSKFLCLSKALEASKVSPSEGITAEQKISKSVFAINITLNDICRLPEGQPT